MPNIEQAIQQHLELVAKYGTTVVNASPDQNRFAAQNIIFSILLYSFLMSLFYIFSVIFQWDGQFLGILFGLDGKNSQFVGNSIIAISASFILMRIFKYSSIQKTPLENPLDDALMPIRKVLLGRWNLEFTEFSNIDGHTTLKADIELELTSARKLNLTFKSSNILNLSGATKEVAFGFVGQDELIFSLVTREKINFGNIRDKEFEYFIRLRYIKMMNHIDSDIKFTGTWHTLTRIGPGYKEYGRAIMTKLS